MKYGYRVFTILIKGEIIMDNFNNIIGYNHIKNELNRIIDCINNRDKYERLGVKIPKNLLLHGVAGVGKTLFANAFINALNRNRYIIRKDMPDGKFVEFINNKIREAIDNQPAVILLDDIDKFSNNDDNHRNSDEFIVVQSLIDDCKDKDIYFVATANSLDDMPNSLLRAGRFDTKIHIEEPTLKDAVKIIEHYLKDKKVDKDIDYEEIAKILDGGSCALLETIINEAGLYAGYDNNEIIRKQDIIKACLRIIYNEPYNEEEIPLERLEVVSYHEAGHALVLEVLEPHSVNLLTIENYFSNKGGLTSSTRNENYWYNIGYMENRIIALLAGKAATELQFNRLDVGAASDLERASTILSRIYNDYYVNDFSKFGRDFSEAYKVKGESWMTLKLKEYYNKAKAILIDNKNKLDKLANELKDKKVLLQNDINNIIR